MLQVCISRHRQVSIRGRVKRDLGEENVQLVTVIGFPFGYSDTATKVFESREAIRQGADELDLVWSQTAYHSGMNWPKIEIAQIAKICHEEERILKVIVETANLNERQLIEACLITIITEIEINRLISLGTSKELRTR